MWTWIHYKFLSFLVHLKLFFLRGDSNIWSKVYKLLPLADFVMLYVHTHGVNYKRIAIQTRLPPEEVLKRLARCYTILKEAGLK